MHWWGNVQVAKEAKDIELTERLQHHDREDAPPETFKPFEANSSTDTVSWFSKALIEVKIFTEREVRETFILANTFKFFFGDIWKAPKVVENN